MPDRVEDLLDQVLDLRLRGEPVEIERLLAEHPELEEVERERLRRLAGLLGEQTGGNSMAPDQVLPPRDLVGAYRILRELGRGGQGVVFLAEDTRFARRVALKVLTRHGLELRDDPQGRESFARLKREAEVLSRLDSPGICVVYEMGMQRNDRYIAMRYVEGETLAKAIAATRAACDPRGTSAARHGRCVALPGSGAAATGSDTPPSTGRSSVDRILALVEQSARALHVAHEAGVVHRDVKPGNIMVTPEGEPVLLDFGLASDVEHATATLTASGGVLGTPAYMSPERLSASQGPVDRRADVYSLGVALYECLTLERPFQAPTREQLYRSILTEQLPRARRSNASIPRDLEVVLEIALEKDVNHRYQTALDLAEDLRRVREHEPIRARPAGILKRGTRWTQRNPGLGAALGGLLLALVSGLVASLHFLAREGDALAAARGGKLVAESRAVLPTNPCLALLLAIEGERRAPGPSANNALLHAIGELRELRMLESRGGRMSQFLPSPDGRFLVTTWDDGTAQVWNAGQWDLITDLAGHSARLNNAAFSLDGSLLATAAADGTCRVWSTATWSSVHVLLESHPDTMVAGFDPTGEHLLTWSTSVSGGTAHIWDVGQGEVLHTFGSSAPGSIHGAYSPDGKRIVLAIPNARIQVWQLDAQAPLPVLEVPDPLPHRDLRIRFSPDGERILIASEQGEANLWDVSSRRKLLSLSSKGRGSCALAFRSDGRRLLVAYPDVRAEIWDVQGGERICVLEGPRRVRNAAAFSADGGRIIACASDQTASVWDAESGEELATFQGHESGIQDAHFSRSGLTVLTGSSDGALREWTLESEGQRSTFSAVAGKFLRACLDPAGKRIAAATDLRSVEVIDLDSPTKSLAFQIPKSDPHQIVQSLTFAPDGRALLTAAQDATARSWNAETGAPLALFQHPAGTQVYDAQFSPDSRFVVTAADDCMARVWNASSGQLLRELVGHTGGVRSAAFGSDGKRIITASETTGDASVRIWDLESDAEPVLLCAEGVQPIKACLSPDGRRALAACRRGIVCMWDIETGKLIWRRAAHSVDADLATAQFSPDGALILTASRDPGARLWNAETGAEVLTLETYRTDVICAAFSADGRWIVTTSRDEAVHLWPVDPRRRARELVPRAFTPAEREHYGLGPETSP